MSPVLKASVVLLGWLAIVQPAAGAVDAGSAPTIAPWLNLEGEASSLGMAGAGSSVMGGAGSVGSNPAGLAVLHTPELSFSHQSLGTNLSADRLAYGMGFGDAKAFGLAIDYLSLGSFETLELDSSGDVVDGPTVAPRGFSGALAYAQRLHGLDVGVAARLISDDPDGQGMAMGFSGDLGLSYNPLAGLLLGASLNQWGTPLLGAQLPTQARLGLSYARPLGERGLALMAAAEERLPTANVSQSSTRVGLQLGIGKAFALRGGYEQLAGLGYGQWRMGLGGGFGGYQLDYAFAPGAEGLASHVVSLSVDWRAAFGGGSRP
jgi:hypothetical protein